MWSYLLNMRRRASNGIEMKLSSALQVLKPLLSTLSLLSPQPAAGRRPILIPQV